MTNTDVIKTIIDDKFREFTDENQCEPRYAFCRIMWLDNEESEDVKIQLSVGSDDENDDIFFYCNGLNDLKGLTERGSEDFIVAECIGFE